MSEKRIKELLSEFHYKKNSLEDTLDFLLLMCFYINERLKNK